MRLRKSLMNELQKNELEILKVFIDICDKLELTYYLVCGSVLGAVKYNGFIPWDDDVDVALMRDDYEKFLSLSPALLPDWLFVQNYRTEKDFPLLMTKLRDSRTTMIETDFADLPINHGIAIDIFPLDGYPREEKEVKTFEKRKKYFTRRQFVRLMGKRGQFFKNIRTTAIWVLYKFFGYCRNNQKLMTKFEAFLSSYSVKDSDLICNHGNWQGILEYAPAEQYGKGTMITFEGIEVRIPERYDEYLRQKYGDYRKDPPKGKQASHHAYVKIDVDNPYTRYVSK